MGTPVALPLWLVALLAVLAGWAVLERLLVPGARWFVRQRTNRVIEELSSRLRIELPAFTQTRRRVLIDRLTWDPRVVEAAAAHAVETGMPREVAMRRVERYAREIVPAFNAYAYFRLGYWLARRVARLLYRVRLGYADEEGLSAARGATVVFVMNHRSNMDYVLVAYLAMSRAALSYAVGEWARVWPLQQLVRSMGGYFIRRGSGNELYRRVLERYVAMATAAGVTQAIYPEGGLSRDGRLRAPRLGLLDYVLRAFDPEGRDVVFVPVGINYDRTLEDRTLLLDLEPERPRPGIVGALRTTARFVGSNLALMAAGRWHRLGYACVNFGTPVSVRAFCAERGLDLRRAGRDERRAAVEALGATLMEAVGRVIPVLPVPLVAAVFARHPGERLDELQVKAAVQTLLAELEEAGAHVYVPRHDRDYAVSVGLRMLLLRRVVRQEADGLYAAVPAERRLLDYYANSIVHLLPEPAPAWAG